MNSSPINPDKKRHLIIAGLLFLVVAVFLGVLLKGLSIDTSKVPSAQNGQKARPFSIELFQGNGIWKDGEKVSLDKLSGKPMVLNFWASWCVSCREEARLVEAAWQAHKNEAIFLGIAIQDTLQDASAFAKSFGKTYALALDLTGQIAIDYGVTGVPETFFIDQTGTIVHREAGPVDKAMIDRFLKELVKQGS